MPFLGLGKLILQLSVWLAHAGIPANIAFAVAPIIVSTGLSAAGNFVLNKLSQIGRRFGQSGFQDRPRHTVTGEIVPARWVLGTARVPGVLCYFGSSGRHASMGLLISEGECEGIDRVCWINGDKVELVRTPDANGDILKPTPHSKYAGHIEVYEYFRADGTQGRALQTGPEIEDAHVRYRTGDGTEQDTPTVDTEQAQHFIIVESPDSYPGPEQLIDDPAEEEHYDGTGVKQGYWDTWGPWSINYPTWGSEHKLDGVSWVAVKLTQTEYGQDLEKRLFTRVPNIEFLVKGNKITWPGQDTPAWTENAAALRYWWETERRGRPASAIHRGDFDAAYTLCQREVTVSLPSGYEDFQAVSMRYSINGMVESGDDVSRVETNMDAAWAGQVVEAGGMIRFRPGGIRPATSSIVLTDKNIIDGPVTKPWPGLQERVNAVNTEILQSREHEWTSLSLPEYVDAPALARDGHQRPSQVRLEYVVDPIAAGRLQATNLRRQRESLRVQFTIMPGENFEHMEYVPTEVVKLTSAELGLTEQLMEVERVEYREDWSVNLTLREALNGTYEDTLVLPPLKARPIKLPDEDAVPTVEGLAADEVAETGRGGKILIQLHISWTAAAVRETEVEVREKPAADAAEEPPWQSGVSVGNRFRYPNVADGKTYQVRARHWNRHGYAGKWAEMERTVGGDVTPPVAPANLQVFSAPEGIRATWENPEDDWWATCIYIGTTNTFDENNLAATLAADVYEAGGWTAGTTYYVWLRAKDTSGNMGQPTEPVAVTPTALADETAKIFTGSGPPDDTDSTAESKDGDLYIDAEGVVWKKVNGVWTKTPIDLTGTDGAKIHTYSGAIPDGEESLVPPDTITNPGIGDIAIHNDSGHWYERTATGWELRGDLTGPPGPKGASVLHWQQDTDPLPTFGVTGDVAIRPDGVWYEKTEDGWQKRGDLTGKAGTKIFNGDVAEDAAPTATGENEGDVFVATDGRWWEWDGSAWQFRSDMAGKDGPGVELIYRRTTEDEAPDMPTLPEEQQQQAKQMPDGWTDDPQGVDADNPFEWVSERRRDSEELWSDFSAPGKWAVYIPGKDGPGLELVFRRTTEDTAPTTPTLPQAQQQQADQVPDGWSDDPVGVDADNPHEWVSRRKRDSKEVWSAFSPPKKWAVYIPGKDGPGLEFVFRQTTEDVAPTTPTLPEEQQQQADQVPDGWSDDPVGADVDNPFEWVSRRKRNSKGVWDAFSVPKKMGGLHSRRAGQTRRAGTGRATGSAGKSRAARSGWSRGRAGRQGRAGRAGQPGTQGARGRPGSQGRTGRAGRPRREGSRGRRRTQGRAGRAGRPGSQGLRGRPRIQGRAGNTRDPRTAWGDGRPRRPRPQGLAGRRGSTGTSGRPGVRLLHECALRRSPVQPDTREPARGWPLDNIRRDLLLVSRRDPGA